MNIATKSKFLERLLFEKYKKLYNEKYNTIFKKVTLSSPPPCLSVSLSLSWAHLQVVGTLRFMSDINQPSLPTPFYYVLMSISVFMALATAFRSINAAANSQVFSLSPCGLISALLVLSTIFLFMEISFSPDIIPSG